MVGYRVGTAWRGDQIVLPEAVPAAGGYAVTVVAVVAVVVAENNIELVGARAVLEEAAQLHVRLV
jgi:hypothetical protein